MKTTKTIEVYVCDNCSSESRALTACVKCAQEVCTNCTNYFSVQVTRWEPHHKHNTGAEYTFVREQDVAVNHFYGLVCERCMPPIVDGLTDLGLQKTPAQAIQPV